MKIYIDTRDHLRDAYPDAIELEVESPCFAAGQTLFLPNGEMSRIVDVWHYPFGLEDFPGPYMRIDVGKWA